MCLCKSRHQGLIESIYPNVPGQSQLNQSNLSYFLYYLQTRPHKLNKSIYYLYILTLRFIYQKSDSFHLITLKIINGVIEQNSKHLNLFIIHLYKIIKELLKDCLDLQQTVLNMPDSSLPALDNPLLPSLMNTFMLINSTYDGSLNIDEEFNLLLHELLDILLKNILTSDTPTAHSISYYALLGVQSILNAPWLVFNKLGEDLLLIIIPCILNILLHTNIPVTSPINLQLQFDPITMLIITMLNQFTSKLSTAHTDKLLVPLFNNVHEYPFIIQFLFISLASHATYQVRTILLSSLLEEYKQCKSQTVFIQLLNMFNQWFMISSNQHVAIPMLELVQAIMGHELLRTSAKKGTADAKVIQGTSLKDESTVQSSNIANNLLECIGTLLVNPFQVMYITATLRWLNINDLYGDSPLDFICNKLLKYSLFYHADVSWEHRPHPKQVLCPEIFVPLLRYKSFTVIVFMSQILQITDWQAHVVLDATTLRHEMHDTIKVHLFSKILAEGGILPVDLIQSRHCLIGLLQYHRRHEHRHECIQLIALLIEMEEVGLARFKDSAKVVKTSLMALQMNVLAMFYDLSEYLNMVNLRHLIVQKQNMARTLSDQLGLNLNLFQDDTNIQNRQRSLSFSSAVPNATTIEYDSLQIKWDNMVDRERLMEYKEILEKPTLTYEQVLALDTVQQKRDSQPNLVITKDGKSSINVPSSPTEQTTYNDLQQVISNPEAIELPKAEVKDQDLEGVLDDLLRPTFAKLSNTK